MRNHTPRQGTEASRRSETRTSFHFPDVSVSQDHTSNPEVEIPRGQIVLINAGGPDRVHPIRAILPQMGVLQIGKACVSTHLRPVDRVATRQLEPNDLVHAEPVLEDERVVDVLAEAQEAGADPATAM